MSQLRKNVLQFTYIFKDQSKNTDNSKDLDGCDESEKD